MDRARLRIQLRYDSPPQPGECRTECRTGSLRVSFLWLPTCVNVWKTAYTAHHAEFAHGSGILSLKFLHTCRHNATVTHSIVASPDMHMAPCGGIIFGCYNLYALPSMAPCGGFLECTCPVLLTTLHALSHTSNLKICAVPPHFTDHEVYCTHQ